MRKGILPGTAKLETTGSILLGELVAILSVMEHLIANSSQIQHRELRIFSDSQTAVGIITLNWVSNHYLDVIKKSMTTCPHWNPRAGS